MENVARVIAGLQPPYRRVIGVIVSHRSDITLLEGLSVTCHMTQMLEITGRCNCDLAIDALSIYDFYHRSP
jgi:hypothetical protein